MHQFTETLIQSGVDESRIGIISLYKEQVKLPQHLPPERVKNGSGSSLPIVAKAGVKSALLSASFI